MKTTYEIKQFCKDVLGVKVKGNTSAGKQHWQGVYIPPNKTALFTDQLTWSAKFPESFRKLCIKVVYPNSPTLHEQPSAGNITAYSIAMLPHEWEQAIAEYPEVLKAEMEAAVEAQDFEKASNIRESFRAAEKYRTIVPVVTPDTVKTYPEITCTLYGA